MEAIGKLAELALAHCPATFDQVNVIAELDDGYAETDLICTIDGAQSYIRDLPIFVMADMHELLDEIREQMAVMSGSRWSRRDLKILSDNSFQLDVTY